MKSLGFDRKRGTMKVVPENIDDLWILYNVIRRGDQIYARTSREVKVEEEGARPTKGRRINLSLGVRVERISFQKDDDRLRANGVVIDAPEDLGLLSSHHTINIALGKPVTILKEEWLSSDVSRIERASQEENNPILVVSVDDDKGCVAILRQHGIDVKAEIDARLPGKLEAEKRSTAQITFFNSLLKGLVLAWNASHSLIAVIGPGFWKESFVKHVREKQPDLFKGISAIRTVGNGGVAGVEEAVRSGVLDIVARRIRVIEETRAVEELLSRLGSQRRDISYGVENVKNAIVHGAVELLLVADELLREADDEKRREMESSMRDVEKMRGRVMIVSAEHEAGRKLLSLGGVAALLRFSID
ncbi:MAG: mRNA surveillance protein pelota [Candidatus Bathyarchaeota archaeon]